MWDAELGVVREDDTEGHGPGRHVAFPLHTLARICGTTDGVKPKEELTEPADVGGGLAPGVEGTSVENAVDLTRDSESEDGEGSEKNGNHDAKKGRDSQSRSESDGQSSSQSDSQKSSESEDPPASGSPHGDGDPPQVCEPVVVTTCGTHKTPGCCTCQPSHCRRSIRMRLRHQLADTWSGRGCAGHGADLDGRWFV
jgi:hypothetical protein